MGKKQRLLVVLSVCIFGWIGTRVPSFIVSKKTARSTTKIKEEIGQTCERVLTRSCDLIGFLSNVQKEIVMHIRSLLTSEKNFFSCAKSTELEICLRELQDLQEELVAVQKKIEVHAHKIRVMCNNT